jgi:predicted glycoside hydrolase/deacetylase ChbG (UPF0249 family)
VTHHLIVNADDFGASDGVNRGIVECHRRGILTSTSMMVTGVAVEEAVQLSRENPDLAIGLHWDVTGEDERDFDLGDHAAVCREWDAQLARFLELMGRNPTHVDSHHHTHLDDKVRDLFLELVAPLHVPLRGHGEITFIGGFYGQWEYGVTGVEHISVEALRGILKNEVGTGWTEVSCHPGYMTPGYRTIYADEREVEIRTLTDPRIRHTLDQLGIELESYATYNRRGSAS